MWLNDTLQDRESKLQLEQQQHKACQSQLVTAKEAIQTAQSELTSVH